VTDAAGNTATASTTITVKDDAARADIRHG